MSWPPASGGTTALGRSPTTTGVVISGVAAAPLVGAVAVIAPKAGALLGMAAIGLVCAWLWPKGSAAGLALVVLFSQPAIALAPSLDLVDDVGILAFFGVTVLRVLTVGHMHRLPGDLAFGLYVLVGLAGAAIQDVAPTVALADGYLFVKGVIFAWSVAQLPWVRRDVEWLGRLGRLAFGLVLVGVVANLLAPGFWFERFAQIGGASARAGLLSLIGPFNHVAWLAEFMVMASLAIAAHGLVFGFTRMKLASLAAAVVVLLSTLRRRAILALLAGAYYVAFSARRFRIRAVVATAIAVPLVVLIGWSTIQEIVDSTYNEYFGSIEPTARVALYSSSVSLAVSHFPLGVGFGLFGGHVAIQNYSPLYYDLGFQYIYGLKPGQAFATDTFWPAILGEAGVVGVLAYVTGLWRMHVAAKALRRIATTRWVAFTGLLFSVWTVHFAVSSVAAPVYSSPPIFPLYFGLAGIVAALLREERKKHERVE